MGKDLSGLRAIAGKRSGMRCHYCRVPTAAEIEHMQPRAAGGSSWMNNLVLSCPYCNKRKGTRSAEDFQNSEDWRLVIPDLPEDPEDMLRSEYGWSGNGTLPTGSRNSRLRIKDGSYWIEIRPGKRYPWQSLQIRGEGASRALWDFLQRHFTRAK